MYTCSHWPFSNSNQAPLPLTAVADVVIWPAQLLVLWSLIMLAPWWFATTKMIPCPLWLMYHCPQVFWEHSLFPLPLHACPLEGVLSLPVVGVLHFMPANPCLLFLPPPRCLHCSLNSPFQARYSPFLSSLLNHVSVLSLSFFFLGHFSFFVSYGVTPLLLSFW